MSGVMTMALCALADTVPCPCGCASASVVHVGNGLELLRCGQCSLLARVKMPTEEEAVNFYRDEYWAHFRREQVGPGRNNVYAHALEWLTDLHPAPGMLVDVGCGGGAFLRHCRDRGWRAIGFDPSPQAVKYAREYGLEVYAEKSPPCSLPHESADAVTFINVLDHLRSEEHTSELQSPMHLVCLLLLEQKNLLSA